MLGKWIPWKWVIRYAARKQGFLDPIALISRLQRFAQPSEVAAPVELLRSAAILHARGLINSQAIQHNLDWVWPYWVEKQFNPRDPSFIPRAFSLTHINLTHRNWIAVGVPGIDEFPIVDPRGLVTPLYDGWSFDVWMISKNGKELIPSKLDHVLQKLDLSTGMAVRTECSDTDFHLKSTTQLLIDDTNPICEIRIQAQATDEAWLAILPRPYNPEGVSFIHKICIFDNNLGFKINEQDSLLFNTTPEKYIFSDYRQGDVYRSLLTASGNQKEVKCKVGMATAAALFNVPAHGNREIVVHVPLDEKPRKRSSKSWSGTAQEEWEHALEGACRLSVPDSHFQFLYDAALKSLVLHSQTDIYPGSYTYRRFWFRDAAFILHALLCAGLFEPVEKALDNFERRQTRSGYFHSQDGEWDSNGEALWILNKFCELTGRDPKSSWRNMIIKGARWIQRKRISPKTTETAHAGLLPAGFSAEHLGPNDYYYWDDFWGVAGLQAAADLLNRLGEYKLVREFCEEADIFMKAIEESLQFAEKRLCTKAMPSSPYRRIDSASIGSLAVGYPLDLWSPGDPRIVLTTQFLLEKCFLKGGFFHDMSHSGINSYLSLHVAQILLKEGDKRFFDIMERIAGLASSTGQWPEAIHPGTLGGCMGDGEHIWAAAEWIMIMRNCFVREEGGVLILCSGIFTDWLKAKDGLYFGPAQTSFGSIKIKVSYDKKEIRIDLEAEWYGDEPRIELRLPGRDVICFKPGQMSMTLEKVV